MYLATSDILPEAHASHPTSLTVLSTIVGVAFIWLVVGLASEGLVNPALEPDRTGLGRRRSRWIGGGRLEGSAD
jgi:hypothetical protein